MARSVFVISPIGSSGTAEHRRYRNTLEYIVKKAFTAPDWEVVRADDETSPDSITTQVIGRIVESDLIVADLTDHNPNVFYELAVAHGYRKPVIHMMEEGQKVPFDVVDQRVIFYDLTNPESVDRAQSGLVSSARWLDDNPSLARNPLSAYDQFSVISHGSNDGDEGRAIATALEQLTAQVARIDARTRMSSPTRPLAAEDSASSWQAREMLLTRKLIGLLEVEDVNDEARREIAALRQELDYVQGRMRKMKADS